MKLTYAGIVVDTCPASAISAILIRKNCKGPWLEDGPRELGNNPKEVPSIDPRPALVPSVPASDGGARPPVGFAGPAFLSNSADFFFLRTMRDRRLCIFASISLFCWTEIEMK